MSSKCPKKVTINLALESIETIKQKASKLKTVECPTKDTFDPCIKKIQIVPVPIRRVRERQIQICKCPTVDFVCPPVPCVCPPCPICPTPAERLRALLKTGVKLSIFYAIAKWTMEQELWGSADHTSKLTSYYSSIFNSLLYGEQKSLEMSSKSTPGFFDVRLAVYKTIMLWNRIVSNLFYVTIGMPFYYLNKLKGSSTPSVEYDDLGGEEENDAEVEE